jgi:hypothetical protein
LEHSDYPALYQAADEISQRAQRAYLNCISLYGYLAVAGAGLAAYGIESKTAAIIAALLFLAGLGISILMAVAQYENTWYRARAVAESIKTSTWRFMMRAEPFEDQDLDIAKRAFARTLRQILQEHKDLASELAGSSSEGKQLGAKITASRSTSLDKRAQVYRTNRIQEQRTWYSAKSRLVRRQGRFWFWGLIALQAAAIVCTVLRVAWPEWKLWPTEVFVVAAASVLGWMQAKRYRELSAAYALTAHEIGLAETGLASIKAEQAFSKFVGDTENAFSREHTQWIARKD